MLRCVCRAETLLKSPLANGSVTVREQKQIVDVYPQRAETFECRSEEGLYAVFENVDASISRCIQPQHR